MLGFGTFIGLIGLIKGKTNIESFFPFLVLILIYAAIFLFEFRLTTSRVAKTLNNLDMQ